MVAFQMAADLRVNLVANRLTDPARLNALAEN
jgi:hypothetical protein